MVRAVAVVPAESVAQGTSTDRGAVSKAGCGILRMRRNLEHPAPHSRRTCCPGSTHFAKERTDQRKGGSSTTPSRCSVWHHVLTLVALAGARVSGSGAGRPESRCIQQPMQNAKACAARNSSSISRPGHVSLELVSAPVAGVEHLPVDLRRAARRGYDVIFLCSNPSPIKPLPTRGQFGLNRARSQPRQAAPCSTMQRQAAPGSSAAAAAAARRWHAHLGQIARGGCGNQGSSSRPRRGAWG